MEPLAPTSGTGVRWPGPPPAPPLSAEDALSLWWIDTLTAALCVVWLLASLGLAALLAAAALWLASPPLRWLCRRCGWSEPGWLTDARPLAWEILLIVDRCWAPVQPLDRALRWAWAAAMRADERVWCWLYRPRR